MTIPKNGNITTVSELIESLKVCKPESKIRLRGNIKNINIVDFPKIEPPYIEIVGK